MAERDELIDSIKEISDNQMNMMHEIRRVRGEIDHLKQLVDHPRYVYGQSPAASSLNEARMNDMMSRHWDSRSRLTEDQIREFTTSDFFHSYPTEIREAGWDN